MKSSMQAAMPRSLFGVLLMGAVCGGMAAAAKKPKPPVQTPLDRYVAESATRPGDAKLASPGSLWSPSSRLADGARDLRASQVDDIVTILVSEQSTATATGATKTARTSKVSNSVTALAGVTKAAGPWANLAGASGQSSLDGQGTTSRRTTMTTTLTARVTQVLPNGNLVLSGSKDVQVNSEHQEVLVRGVIRPIDLSPDNQVGSDRLAQLEVRINGKGVVNDAVHRPFILYRLLLGLLPF
jgi:flagellar L-ring protein precursor FlgH